MIPFWKPKAHHAYRGGLDSPQALLIGGLRAADRTEITFADGRIFPESLTSTKNGVIWYFFGSLGTRQRSSKRDLEVHAGGHVGSSPRRTAWRSVLGVPAGRAGRSAVGLRVGESGGRRGAPYVGEAGAQVRSSSRTRIAQEASYPLPGQRAVQRHRRGEGPWHGVRDRHQHGAGALRLKKGAERARRLVGGTLALLRHGGRRRAARPMAASTSNSVGQGMICCGFPSRLTGRLCRSSSSRPRAPSCGRTACAARSAAKTLLLGGRRPAV